MTRRRTNSVCIAAFSSLVLIATTALAGVPPSTLLQKTAPQISGTELAAMERDRVLKLAGEQLPEPPVTITAYTSSRSAGGPHDYFSEGDYWWPDSANPDGPYIRRDGLSNPGNFVKHREVMFRLCTAVSSLAAAYKLTRDEEYAAHAVRHLKAWFVDESTMMFPRLLYAQAVKGRFTGRGIGIIDTIHLIEVARSIEVLSGSASFSAADLAAVKRWFAEYLHWLITHKYGIEERDAKNNHGTWWVAQVAAFAHLAGDSVMLAYCRSRFSGVLLPTQMALEGGFSLELQRTKPYSYSIFNLEGMTTICQILSVRGKSLWEYTLPDGRSMRRGMEFLFPYLKDRSTWPYARDVANFDDFPVRHSLLLFGGNAFGDARYLDLWKTLKADPSVPEVLRALPIRQPLLWVE